MSFPGSRDPVSDSEGKSGSVKLEPAGETGSFPYGDQLRFVRHWARKKSARLSPDSWAIFVRTAFTTRNGHIVGFIDPSFSRPMILVCNPTKGREWATAKIRPPGQMRGESRSFGRCHLSGRRFVERPYHRIDEGDSTSFCQTVLLRKTRGSINQNQMRKYRFFMVIRFITLFVGTVRCFTTKIGIF